MKRLFAIAAAALLCLSLVACGGETDPEHEYILSLLEKQDYDMAILVIEGIRDREFGPRPTVQETAAAEEPSTEPETQPVGPEFSGVSSLVYGAVSRFMAEKDRSLMVSLPLTVTDAAEYRLGNFDGNGSTAHCILVNVQADVFYDNTVYDQLQLALDPDTGNILNSAQIDWNIMDGSPENEEEFYYHVMNSFQNYVLDAESILWADTEIIEELSADEITALNKALADSL